MRSVGSVESSRLCAGAIVIKSGADMINDEATFGQVCIKEPGQVNGQMFIIEDCEDCDIYVCDYTAQVQIDYCKNCRIFVGPSESSVSTLSVLQAGCP